MSSYESGVDPVNVETTNTEEHQSMAQHYQNSASPQGTTRRQNDTNTPAAACPHCADLQQSLPEEMVENEKVSQSFSPPPPQPHPVPHLQSSHSYNHNPPYHQPRSQQHQSPLNLHQPQSNPLHYPEPYPPHLYYPPPPSPTGQRMALAVTAGSLLGLTAAAAVRWLNGGDFAFFPPATAAASTRSTSHQQVVERSCTSADETAATVALEQRGHGRFQEQHQQQLLLDAVQAQSEKQTLMTHRLEDLVKHQQRKDLDVENITKQSIDLLRNQHVQQHTDEPRRVVVSLLHEIKGELTAIRESLRDEMSADSDPLLLHSRILTVIAKLDATLNDDDGITLGSTEATNTTEKLRIDDTQIGPIRTNTPSHDFSSPHKDAIDVVASKATATMTLVSSVALKKAVLKLVVENANDKLVAGAQLLYLYVLNVFTHPRVPRYRKIYCNNESFQSHVAELLGARELLAAVGFVEQAQLNKGNRTCWEWLPTPPSIRNDDSLTEVKTLPQRLQLDGSEVTYLERLKEAVSALSVLKVASAAEKEDLTKLALSAAGLLLPDKYERTIEITGMAPLAAEKTPLRTNGTTTANMTTSLVNVTLITDPSMYQTPVSGSSLPLSLTKKILPLPPGDIPSLDHAAKQVEKEARNPPTAEFDEHVERSDSSNSDSLADAAEAAMWK